SGPNTGHGTPTSEQPDNDSAPWPPPHPSGSDRPLPRQISDPPGTPGRAASPTPHTNPNSPHHTKQAATNTPNPPRAAQHTHTHPPSTNPKPKEINCISVRITYRSTFSCIHSKQNAFYALEHHCT
ncbi:MAG: hypothetical protein GX467_10210, partial [Rikenellaceae bacterium]|nr:hypothetical protein [Rikenellaceae bacterium]